MTITKKTMCLQCGHEMIGVQKRCSKCGSESVRSYNQENQSQPR